MSAEDRGSSLAEPPASPRHARWVGAIAVALLLGGFALKLAGPGRTRVPDGIAGVKLGSTLDEARRALPELAGAPPYRARTLLFEEPATCTLELAVNERLSRIDCVLDAAPDVEQGVRAREKLLATLRELYGKESRTRDGSWLWQNDQARLLLATTPQLHLSSWSAAHEAARVEPPPIAADR